jgi:hypothetical protein
MSLGRPKNNKPKNNLIVLKASKGLSNFLKQGNSSCKLTFSASNVSPASSSFFITSIGV